MTNPESTPTADSGRLPDAPCSGLDFSGTTCEGAEWHRAWLAFTDGEYYHRCRQIMLGYSMGCGDVEMILANFWESGWIAAKHHGPNEINAATAGDGTKNT